MNNWRTVQGRFALRAGVYVLSAGLFLAAFFMGQWVGRSPGLATEGAAYWSLLAAVAIVGLLASFVEREFLWSRVFAASKGRLDPGPLSLGLFGGFLVGLLRFQV